MMSDTLRLSARRCSLVYLKSTNLLIVSKYPAGNQPNPDCLFQPRINDSDDNKASLEEICGMVAPPA